MLFIFCSVRIPTSYGILMAMVDVGKYILSIENNFRRQVLPDFVVHRPEIFKNAGFDSQRPTHRNQRKSFGKPYWHRSRRF